MNDLDRARPAGGRIALAHAVTRRLYRHWFPGAGTVRRTVARLLIPGHPEPVVLSLPEGFRIYVDPRNDAGVERSLYRFGTYEAGTLDFISKAIRPGDTVFDVGSNIGLMSLVAASRTGPTGRVYAFEPAAATHRILRHNIDLNGFSQIETVPIALGSGPGKATIHHHATGGRGMASLQAEEGTVAGEEVPIEALDSFIARRGIGRIDLMKVDVEGWETEVLLGARSLLGSDGAPILVVEYSRPHRKGAETDLYEYIRGVNAYQVYKLARGKSYASALVPIHGPRDLPEHDNLFCVLAAHRGRFSPNRFRA